MRTLRRSIPFACIILSKRSPCLKAATVSFGEGPIFAQEALYFRNPLMERGKVSPSVQNPHFTKIGRLSRRCVLRVRSMLPMSAGEANGLSA